MSTLRRLIVVFVLAALAVGAAQGVCVEPASAKTKAQVRKELKQARAKIKNANQRKQQLAAQIAALDRRLTEIESELIRLGERIDAVQAKLAATRARLAELREQLRLKRLELAAAEAKLRAEEENLQTRVVLAYKTSDLTYVDVVLASTSFEDLVTRTSMVRDLIDSNDELVGDLEEARDVVDRERASIAEKEDTVHQTVIDLQEQSDELVALRGAQADRKAQSLAARKEKSSALAAVKNDLAVLKRQEAQLLAESRQLSGIITDWDGGGGGTGQMIRPVNGVITSPFGWRMHPILHYRRFHTGVDFGVGYGAPIRAADGGTVIYASWMGGYGNVAIISHGGGISTLYAHQSALLVGYGSSVARGAVIGRVGSTGLSTGPHLHFEVRVNGNPVDPMGYIN